MRRFGDPIGEVAAWVTGDPNGEVSAPAGAIAVDIKTGTTYQNTNGGTTWATFSSSGVPTATGRLLGIQRLTATSGTYTPTTGTTRVRVRMVGGGGGSGSIVQHATEYTQTGGGCGGAYFEKTIVAAGGITGGAYAVGAAGAAGASGAANAGGNGGNTTIVIQGVTYTASGGGGGEATDGGAGIGPSGGGQGIAATSTGDVNYQEPGQTVMNRIPTGANVIAQGGKGGGNQWGAGGRPGNVYNGGNTNPVAATGYGAGGGGIAQAPGASTAAGRAGTAGLIIVEEWS